MRSTVTRRSKRENVPMVARNSPGPSRIARRPAGRPDLDVPSERSEHRLELRGLIEDLDRAELPAVFQLAEHRILVESGSKPRSFRVARLTNEETRPAWGRAFATRLQKCDDPSGRAVEG